jgi:cytochrome b subunit of formate dehydrogenase
MSSSEAMRSSGAAAPTASVVERSSERVTRHRLADRVYHWLMAASVLILIGSAFLPILGWKFEWVSLHWMTGIALALLVLIHIVRALFWQDWRGMLPDGADIHNAWRSIRHAISMGEPARGRSGKYKLLQKLYHLAVAALVLSIIASGMLMLLKIDTPLWRRSPYWFEPDTWGVIYSIHGFASMALLTLVMIHIYFALRPDEWWLTRSMFRGYISRQEYADHCDNSRWRLPDRA